MKYVTITANNQTMPLYTYAHDILSATGVSGQIEGLAKSHDQTEQALSVLIVYLCEAGILTAEQVCTMLGQYEDSMRFD